MDVDAVILWVDGNDPAWFADYKKYCEYDSLEFNSKNRFRDWDNLQYLFRGIDKFLPWIRHVHFVTFGHLPSWLDLNSEKIKIHKHTDIFSNKMHLPVFNASSIELNINNINGLAENFIYFNDDFFILQQLPITRFFKDNKPVDFLIEGLSRSGYFYRTFRGEGVWISMINNSLREVNVHFQKRKLLWKHRELFFNKSYGFFGNIKNIIFSYKKTFNSFEHYHLPQPYCKRTLQYADDFFRDVINQTSASRFRHHSNVSQALYRYIHLARGDFYPERYSDYAIFPLSDLSSYKELEKNIFNYKMVCINDEVTDEDDFPLLRDALNRLLDRILPDKCSFEL
ncbi:TPA: Stealth CR1 domain-containing protein [Citrobacter freundii]